MCAFNQVSFFVCFAFPENSNVCCSNCKVFLPVQRCIQIATKSTLLAAFFISALFCICVTVRMKTVITHLSHLSNLFDLATGEDLKTFPNNPICKSKSVPCPRLWGLAGWQRTRSLCTKHTDSPPENWPQCFYTEVSAKGMFRRLSVKAVPFWRVILLFLQPSHRELPQCSHFLSMSREWWKRALLWHWFGCAGCWGRCLLVMGFVCSAFCPWGALPKQLERPHSPLAFLWVIPLLIPHTNLSCWEQVQQLWQSQTEYPSTAPEQWEPGMGQECWNKGSKGITFSQPFFKLVYYPAVAIAIGPCTQASWIPIKKPKQLAFLIYLLIINYYFIPPALHRVSVHHYKSEQQITSTVIKHTKGKYRNYSLVSGSL